MVVAPAVAFAGGLLSFLSPCVLPLVPSYIGFISGMTLDEIGRSRHRALLHAACFVSGFSLVFILMGAGATALGASVLYHKAAIAQVGGVVLIVFGLYTVGALRIAWLDREHRWHLEQAPAGLAGSMFVGMTFAAGWTPCIGPILGAILGLAGSTGSVAQGIALLAAYSAGLAIPFLVAAVALDHFRAWFLRVRGRMRAMQVASGLLLIAVGALLVSGNFTRMAGWLQGMTPAFLRQWL